MSSLRVESLRLCWVEAFVAVAEAENFSAAARELGVSQPTVSRYLQSLERWSGKKLVEPGRISDPEDPGVSVAVTEEGRKFFDLAEELLEKLTTFRTVGARRQEEILTMQLMVGKMHADLTSSVPSIGALRERRAIEMLHRTVACLNEETPLKALVTLKKRLWRTFSAYEAQKLSESRKLRMRSRSTVDPKALRINP